MRSNENFWRVLLQYSRSTSYKVIAHVTHSADEAVWVTPDAIHALLAQQDFIRNGGEIKRIIVGQEEEPSKTQEEVMNLIARYGIDVYYSKGTDDDFGTDFALVVEHGVVMEWHHNKRHGRVVRCYFLHTPERTYENKWKRLYDSRSRKFDKKGATTEHFEKMDRTSNPDASKLVESHHDLSHK